MRYGKELAEGIGIGQPLSMKLKNVHLPHPHPNGGFSLAGGLVLLLCLLWWGSLSGSGISSPSLSSVANV